MIRVKSKSHIFNFDWHEIIHCEVRCADVILKSKRFPGSLTTLTYEELFSGFIIQVNDISYYDRDILLGAVEQEAVWRKLSESN